MSLVWLVTVATASAESARIVKVLPYFVDKKGHHALKPSLYERDAYQAYLRRNPELVSAVRFDIQWKASGVTNLTLRVEARGNKDGQPTQVSHEVPAVRRGLIGRWTSVSFDRETYVKFGRLTAWRATLWSGGRQVAETKSFLW